MPIDPPEQDPLSVGPHEGNVRRSLYEVKPNVERIVLELFRMAEEDWDAHPVPNCEVWRECGSVFAARISQ